MTLIAPAHLFELRPVVPGIVFQIDCFKAIYYSQPD